ncbi:helix-turn-helix protein [Halanaerobium saccharolyticum]|uniref:Helix-turn-helix protein n=1 Tax=Halanaerobium saccharolyticum TaxID=43595 RepID=A0A4R7Z9G3_9FIRM|nr:helix-turn-helix transcriptional regulator [Halanaerobium saccharolyticum]RAK12553.1 helix-turn-helix protein [Halanaerobium saccharolyticum]TDW06479.1 helix-turn-helix protein [Halanaerobium saccharolyticum]TDX61727.1 helix-turn-helix protein [Halanaerobium saccharolyticum]
MLNYEKIAQRLKEARLDMNYSQQEVADLIGKKRSQISYYETGARKINLSLLNKFSNLYGKSIEYFIGESTEEEQLEIAHRSTDIKQDDLEKIEWAKNFVNNLYELKNMQEVK